MGEGIKDLVIYALHVLTYIAMAAALVLGKGF